jgi:adenylate cyclase
MRRGLPGPAPGIAASAVAAPVQNSIAVLPFENLSDAKDNAYFAEGVHHQIVADLTKIPELKVISRTSVMNLKESGQGNLRDIARSLGASYILEGSIQRIGSRVCVTAQLVDGGTDTHLWADRYERDLKDVFATETELADLVVAQVKSTLSRPR